MCRDQWSRRHPLIDRAIRIALAERAPTALIFPSDVLDLTYEPPRQAFKQVPSSLGVTSATPAPEPDAVSRAAEILNSGERVAMLVGQGARGCAPELITVADILGAGCAKALLGRDVLPDTLPWVTGSIGLLGTTASHRLMSGCDTPLTVGSNFPYSQFLPSFGQARGVQIDHSPEMIGMRYPNELNVVGDARATLQALIPLLEAKTDRSWRDKVEADVERWWTNAAGQAMTDADPVNPMRIFHEFSPRAPSNCIITADSGSAANWDARHIVFRDEMRGSLSGTLATMGPAVPYAIGAKWAHPDRPAVAFEGDGAMQMNGLAEMITVAHYWQQWTDPRLVVVVLHNNDLNQVTWEQRAMSGSPKFAASQELPDVDYAAFARGIGLVGINVDDPDGLGTAWDTALAADRPALLDVRCDPTAPSVPPHATREPVLALGEALVKGDDDAWAVAKNAARQGIRQFLPGRQSDND